jgi:hypothetical protein
MESQGDKQKSDPEISGLISPPMGPPEPGAHQPNPILRAKESPHNPARSGAQQVIPHLKPKPHGWERRNSALLSSSLKNRHSKFLRFPNLMFPD